MLTTAQREAFDRQGFVRLPGAFSQEAAAAMEERLWAVLEERSGAKRDDPASWDRVQVTGLQFLRTAPVFRQIGSETTRAAIDDLMGAGRWQRPSHWGQFLVTFPSGETAWSLPHRLWHTDFPLIGPSDRVFGALVFSFLSTVPAGTGGTLVVQGSPQIIRRWVERVGPEKLLHSKIKVQRHMLLRSHPWLDALSSRDDSIPREERITRFMERDSDVDGTPARVVELTGEPGEIVIAHPLMLHNTAPNCGSRPRFMCVQRIRPEGFGRRRPGKRTRPKRTKRVVA